MEKDIYTLQLEKFDQSCKQLGQWLVQWSDRIKAKAIQNDRNRAAWLVWGRYSLAICTFHQICKPNYFPDLLLIGRSCLEYEATLKGIMDDPSVAEKYLAFLYQAKAYYACLLERQGQKEKAAQLEPSLKEKLGDDWRKKKATAWTQTSELVEKYGGEANRYCYALWSHFTHCSVVASEFLENTPPSPYILVKAVNAIYSGYVLVTHDFLEFVWGPIVTSESEQCKNKYIEIMKKGV